MSESGGDGGALRAAAELHRESLVVDLHADTSISMRLFGYRPEKRHRGRFPFHFGFWHCDLPRFAAGGVDGQFFGLVTSPWPRRGCARSVLKQIARFRAVERRAPDRLRFVRTAAELRVARADGLLAGLFGIEGAHNLEGDPGWIARFADEGVRYLGLAHLSSNAAAPAAAGPGGSHEASLTPLGREVVAEMNRVGMIVDLAHVGRRAFLEAAALAKRPVIVSHTGVGGAYRHWRNIDDEQLRAVAERDGVVGVIFAGLYLAPWGRRGVDAVVAHMEWIRDTIGARHVALGSDFDGFIKPVSGLEDVSKLGTITATMLARGWPEDDIRGALGENALRVLAAHGG